MCSSQRQSAVFVPFHFITQVALVQELVPSQKLRAHIIISARSRGLGDHKPEPDPGGGEQSKWLEKVQEALKYGQRLKVARPPGQLDATQEMEMAKAKEMGWSYEEVDVFDVLEEQFEKAKLVDAWCEETKSWRRGTVEKQDLVDTEQEDGSDDTVVRWTLRCQITKQTFDAFCICSTLATMKAMLDHVGRHLRSRDSTRVKPQASRGEQSAD